MQSTSHPPLPWYKLVAMAEGELLKHCQRDSFKGTGAGGQKKNKTSSGVRLTYLKTQVSESGYRSKEANQKAALKKLKLKLATNLIHDSQLRSPHPDPLKIIMPYVQKKILRVNEKNPDFPLFSGALLDLIVKLEGDVLLVSEQMGVSKSQIYKFFDSHRGLKETFTQVKKYFYDQTQ